MGKHCKDVRKITYKRDKLETSIKRIDCDAFLVVETVKGRDAEGCKYQIVFSGSAQRKSSKHDKHDKNDYFISNTQVVITMDNKSANITVQDIVNENYRTKEGTYKDLNSGNKFVVVDDKTAYFCMNY